MSSPTTSAIFTSSSRTGYISLIKDSGVQTIWHHHKRFFSIRLGCLVDFRNLASTPSQAAFPFDISPDLGLYRRRKLAASPVSLRNKKLNRIQLFWCHVFISSAFTRSEPMAQRIDVWTAAVAGTICENLAVAEKVGVDPWCSRCCSPPSAPSSFLAGVSSSLPCCCSPRFLVIAGDWRVRVLPRCWILFCSGHFCPSMTYSTSGWRMLITDCAVLLYCRN